MMNPAAKLCDGGRVEKQRCRGDAPLALQVDRLVDAGEALVLPPGLERVRLLLRHEAASAAGLDLLFGLALDLDLGAQGTAIELPHRHGERLLEARATDEFVAALERACGEAVLRRRAAGAVAP